MFRNYFISALRNITKNKIFSLINIAGLALGIAACLMILQYVSFQLSFDQFNSNAKNLYRVVNDRYQNGKLIQHGTITYSAIGKALQDDYAEVINHARVMPYGKTIITYENKRKSEEDIIAVDNSFLTMFSYPLLVGDAKTALTQPGTVVISETSARRIFNVVKNDFSPCLDKLIQMANDSATYKVTGVFRDVPENSHLSFDMLASYTSLLSGSSPYAQADHNDQLPGDKSSSGESGEEFENGVNIQTSQVLKTCEVSCSTSCHESEKRNGS